MLTVADAAARLERTNPAEWLLAFDFDGVLSPIVPHPGEARPDPRLMPLLDQLAAVASVPVVISGRPRAFLAEHLPGFELVGSYGAETGEGGRPALPPVSLGEAEQALRVLAASIPGSEVEPKPLGLGFHLRNATVVVDAAAVREALERVASATGLEVQPGRQVLELRPAGAPDKGQALEALVGGRRPSAVVYVGDDLGDLPAFAAARRAPCPSLTVAIPSDEVPADAFAGCDLVLAYREELLELARALLRVARRN